MEAKNQKSYVIAKYGETDGYSTFNIAIVKIPRRYIDEIDSIKNIRLTRIGTAWFKAQYRRNIDNYSRLEEINQEKLDALLKIADMIKNEDTVGYVINNIGL